MNNKNNKRYQDLLDDELLNVEMRSQKLSGWLLAATIVVMNIFAQADHAPNMQSFVNFTLTLSAGLVIWFLGTAILIGRGIYHPAFKYLNLLLQVSTVTFYMLATARLVDANFALSSTAPLFYLLIIGLTSLTINPLLSLLAGILAAIQFIGAYALRLEEATFMPGLDTAEGAWVQISLKGFMFIMMGVTAMLIARSSRKLLEKVISEVSYKEQLRFIEDDMDQAAEIQEKLIPDSDINPRFYQIESFYSPARQVGGDYFDIIELSQDRCLIVIADVSGKGYSAALLMSNIQAMVKTLANQDFTLVHMAEFINQSVLHNSVRGKFVTIVFMILDPHQKNLQYINCGHNPPLMVRGSYAIEELDQASAALGIMKDYQCKASVVDFSPGDIVLGYTDGLSELRDTDGHQLGIHNIKKILQINNQLDPKFIKQYLLASIYEHASEAEVNDDLSFVCIQAKSSESDQIVDPAPGGE